MSHQISVIGLGGGDMEQLPLGIYRKLTHTNKGVYTRTENHPVIDALKKEGVTFQSFDTVYELFPQFQQVYEYIVDTLVTKAEEENVIYAVPGHPMLAEQTVQLLLKRQEQGDVSVRIEGGQSFLDDLFSSLKIDPIEGFQLIDGTDFKRHSIQYQHHVVFCQVYDTMIASNVKLTLMEDLPYDYPVTIAHAVGSSQERIQEVPLHDLDRQMELSNLTSVYIPPVADDFLHHQFFKLRDVMATLRSPQGCPWDRKQTHESLRSYVIEEAYELIQAINDQDDEGIVEELGDVLLQVMLHSQIGEDQGYFTIDDVIHTLTEKMIRRHPHVFTDQQVQSAEEVVGQWEAIKREEKGKDRQSILDGVVKALPELIRAQELQKKAAKVGFDWKHPEPMWEKVDEELQEFKESLELHQAKEQELEFGDLLFALVNLSRYYKINPELAIQRTNEKFERRFRFIEEQVELKGVPMTDLSLEELDRIWDQAKLNERSDT